MRIGCPKEIKPQEGRVGLTPACVDALVRAGHQVFIEQNAGIESGFTDGEYTAVGAQILATPAEVYSIADMIVNAQTAVVKRAAISRFCFASIRFKTTATRTMAVAFIKSFIINQTGALSNQIILKSSVPP